MILHIPHSKTFIPEEYLKEYNKKLLDKGINELTDFKTDELFEHWNSTSVIFEYSRFFCDVERFRKNDSMEKIGQGVLYTHYNDEILRVPSEKTNKEVYNLYDEHHKDLIKNIEKVKTLYPENIIVDCHSFSDKKNYPDFCIGYNDDISNDIKKLIKEIIQLLSQKYTVKTNFPYEGALIPDKYNDDNTINSIMIEVNKKLYMKNEKKHDNFKQVQNDIYEVLDIISHYEIRKDK